MIATVYPGILRGTVSAPPSKSAAHRALICAALADAPTAIRLGTLNRDIEATMACLRALGAAIAPEGDDWQVAPMVRDTKHCALDCGESGSTLRFLIPVAAALRADVRFVGHGRLPERPNAVLTDALRKNGATIDGDLLPMRVSGGLKSGWFELPGNVSSQYISGLLFALPLLEGDSEIRLTAPLQSASYVNLTIQALSRFGVAVERTKTGWFVPGGQRYRSPARLAIEGDWSAAAFWLAANATGSAVDVEGLDPDSAQGDRAVVKWLGESTIDATDVPDLVPALAVAAAARPGMTVITGAARLRLKESDRLETVAGMLKALGIRADVHPDGLAVYGGSPHGGTVNGANDHRIVMAAAIAATAADGPVTITGAEAVAKSYPDFFRDFNALGGHAHVEQSGS